MDILYELRQRFNILREEAESDANKSIEEFLKQIEFQNLSVEEKILQLCSQVELLKDQIENFSKREYADYWQDDVWLFNCFMHQFLVYNQDDSEQIGQGILLGYVLNRFIELVRELRKEHPKYTYEDFINGKDDLLVYELFRCSPVLPREEYIKIHSWQGKYTFIITEHERLLMQGLFRAHCKDKDHIAEIVREKEVFDAIHSFDTEVGEDELIGCFKKLIVLKDYDFGTFDKRLWKQAFDCFNKDMYLVKCLIPESVNSLLERYASHPVEVPISSLSLLFYSLARYERWLDAVLGGSILIEDDWVIDYEKEIQHAIEQGKKRAAEYERKLHAKKAQLSHVKGRYLKLLFAHADDLRMKLKSEAHLLYFSLAEDIERLTFAFQHHCCHKSCLEQEAKILKEAYELFGEVGFIWREIRDIFNQTRTDQLVTRKDFCPDSIFYKRILFLESDLLKKYKKLTDELSIQRRIGKYPTIFIVQNFNEGLNEILDEAYSRLQQVLERQQQNHKVIYIQTKLKDLRLRELDAKRYHFKVCDYHLHFKDLLELEAEFVMKTMNIDMRPSLKELKALPELKRLPEPEEIPGRTKALCFGYKGKTEELLREIYRGLNSLIDFIDEDETTEDEFVAVLTAKDLTQIDTPIYFGCSNPQVSYVLESMQRYFKDLTFANIERAQLFYSKQGKGKSFTANNLYKSKKTTPQKKPNIDKFFRILNQK